MDTSQLPLLIGGIATGVAGIITAIAMLVRAFRPMSQASNVARHLYAWLDGHDLADLVPRDLFTTNMTADELRSAYQHLERTRLLEALPRWLRRQVEKVIEWDDDDEDRDGGGGRHE